MRLTDDEYEILQRKCEAAGYSNLSTYIRKMIVDGYIIELNIPSLYDLSILLRRSSNNINQIAKRVNINGRVYAEDIAEVQNRQNELWTMLNKIILNLSNYR